MPRKMNYQKPKNAGRTLGRIFGYMLHEKWRLILVAVFVCISAAANVTGTYLLKPLLNVGVVPLIGKAPPRLILRPSSRWCRSWRSFTCAARWRRTPTAS